jgi:hypothetical protein
VGALVFTLVYTAIVAPIVKMMDYGKITLADVLHLPAIAVALVVGAIFIAVIKFLPTQLKKT